MGVLLRAHGRAWASHRSAARLWGLGGVADDVIEITTTANLRGPKAVSHFVRYMSAADRRVRDSIPVTSVERTLADLGSVSPGTLEAAVIDALKRGLTTRQRLKSRVPRTRGRGTVGAARLRRVLERWGDDAAPPESVLEMRFRQLIHGHRLPPVVPQHEVAIEGGGRCRVDFAYPEHLIAIEVDGYRWHGGDPARWRGDLRRGNALTSRGWRVLRFSWDDMQRHPVEVARTIRRALLSEPSAERKGTTREAAT
ncbi:MAG: endonuclease domain-containing protein [Actinomycetota bacterium]|nr:endonuclease domain-containing protein [Actinomycetota bacterium]